MVKRGYDKSKEIYFWHGYREHLKGNAEQQTYVSRFLDHCTLAVLSFFFKKEALFEDVASLDWYDVYSCSETFTNKFIFVLNDHAL